MNRFEQWRISVNDSGKLVKAGIQSHHAEMSELILTVRETADRRGRFDGWIDHYRVVSSSRTPFLSAARILMRAGEDPNTILIMVHERTGTRSLKGPIRQAAKLGVREDDGGIRFAMYENPRSRIKGSAETAVVAKDYENG